MALIKRCGMSGMRLPILNPDKSPAPLGTRKWTQCIRCHAPLSLTADTTGWGTIPEHDRNVALRGAFASKTPTSWYTSPR